MRGLTRDGMPNLSRETKLSAANGHSYKGKKHFSCSADNEQDWQPYPHSSVEVGGEGEEVISVLVSLHGE